MSLRKRVFMMALALGLGGAEASRPAPDDEPAPVTRRIPQFENDAVRVWKSVIVPGQPLSLHRHERGRVIVALKGGTLEVVKESGESHPLRWETGKAYWLAADPPGERHGDRNPGPEAIEVMVVELAR
jgi:quercetin dioxygenase-like cupin family protein